MRAGFFLFAAFCVLAACSYDVPRQWVAQNNGAGAQNFQDALAACQGQERAKTDDIGNQDRMADWFQPNLRSDNVKNCMKAKGWDWGSGTEYAQ